ncbi:MAG: hypothetical protein ACLQNE_45790 [Thermoguttaceae bacterium]
MRRWLNDLDRILRGEATRPSALREQTIELPLGGLCLVMLTLALAYGACSGFYAGFRAEDPSSMQWLATTLKVPALFFLTLGVTFPSLYVFNALVGSRLNLVVVLQLLVAALAVNLAVLASMGPIVAFFSFSTTSYPFMFLLNVLIFTVSGLLGMAFLLQTLHRLSVSWPALPSFPPRSVPEPEGRQDAGERELNPHQAESAAAPGALDTLEGHVLGRHVKTVFICWTVIFSVVGAQMAWVLRPFFGKPHEAFHWFCPRESNFFEYVWQTLRSLFS